MVRSGWTIGGPSKTYWQYFRRTNANARPASRRNSSATASSLEGECCGRSWRSIWRRSRKSCKFRYSDYGKPVLAPPWGSHGLRFNLSHCEGLGLLAVAAHEVGTDVEHGSTGQ